MNIWPGAPVASDRKPRLAPLVLASRLQTVRPNRQFSDHASPTPVLGVLLRSSLQWRQPPPRKPQFAARTIHLRSFHSDSPFVAPTSKRRGRTKRNKSERTEKKGKRRRQQRWRLYVYGEQATPVLLLPRIELQTARNRSGAVASRRRKQSINGIRSQSRTRGGEKKKRMEGYCEVKTKYITVA